MKASCSNRYTTNEQFSPQNFDIIVMLSCDVPLNKLKGNFVYYEEQRTDTDKINDLLFP